MHYQIDDPTFSVWNLVQRVENRSTLVNHRQTMSLISHEVEDVTLSLGEKATIFANFQYLSRFLPQFPRYERIAKKAAVIYVFGVPDVEMPRIPNVYYVGLHPNDALAREWFIVSHSHNYASALATQEQSRFTDPDDMRTFKGIWTFDKDLVSVLHMWLKNMLNVRDMPIVDNPEYDHQRQVMTVTREIERLDCLREKYADNHIVSNEIFQLSRALKQEAIQLMSGRG